MAEALYCPVSEEVLKQEFASKNSKELMMIYQRLRVNCGYQKKKMDMLEKNTDDLSQDYSTALLISNPQMLQTVEDEIKNNDRDLFQSGALLLDMMIKTHYVSCLLRKQ